MSCPVDEICKHPIPEPGPLSDIFFDPSVRAMVVALFVNKPAGGHVESVLTLDIHRFFLAMGLLV
jgi:hypothetical protein